MFDYQNNQEELENNKKSKENIKNKESFMNKFGKKFSELFSKISCGCYSNVSHQGYQNMDNRLIEENSSLKYNIDSHIDEIPDDSDEISDDSEENQDSPRPIYTDDVILVENHRKQDSLSEINI